MRIGTCIGKYWKIMFVSIGWHIWKVRNDEVFENKKFSLLVWKSRIDLLNQLVKDLVFLCDGSGKAK